MKRELIYIIVIVALASAVTYLVSRPSQSRVESAESILEEKTDTIRAVENKDGSVRFEKKSAAIDHRDIDLLESSYRSEIQDLKKSHGAELKDLHAYYAGKIESSGSGSIPFDPGVNNGDSTELPKISINEKYFTFTGEFMDGRLDYSYSVMDSLSIAWSWTKKGLWPFKTRDKLMVSLSSKNSNTKLLSATSFAIVDRKKVRLTIGPHAGVGTNGISAGISIQYPLIKIRW